MTETNETRPKDSGKIPGDDNSKVVRKLLYVVVGMFGFGFALVPIYDVFCEVTGLNGKTRGQQTLSAENRIDETREITVNFIASLNGEMPWDFEPTTKSIKVHPGKPTRITYVATNRTEQAIIGNAVPSVAPGKAAPYFSKTECFCFTEQLLEAGEAKEMPVVFVVEPDLPDEVSTLTLSYTFFVKPGSETNALASR